MTAALPRTSLVIVSRHRRETLLRCLKAVAQLDHPGFELVVVADPEAAAAVRRLGLPLKLAEFDLPNISAARNAGIELAAGEVVAFTDDDAVPEPTWLARLSAPFADPQAMAAGGPVRSRNGISWQWRGGTVDGGLQPGRLALPETGVSLQRGAPGLAIEVKGVNCAYRRETLARLGGFDPALRYYLDETELNLRLAGQGAAVAWVADAVVHHFKAGSRQRSARQVPLSLFDIGASTLVTLRRQHVGAEVLAAAVARLLAGERAKLERRLVGGDLEPRDLRRLLHTLLEGIAAGGACDLQPLAPLGPPAAPFLVFPAGPRPGRLLAGRIWQARRLRAEAARCAAAGELVTLFLFDPSARYHWQRYDPAGFWEQSGGLFGRSLREGPRWRCAGFAARLRREAARIAPFRPV